MAMHLFLHQEKIIPPAPHLPHWVSLPLCFQLYHSLLPRAWFSPLPLIISPTSHLPPGVLAIKCKTGYSVSPTHAQRAQETQGLMLWNITILRRTGKLFYRLHFFSLFIFHGCLSVFVRTILVVGIKTEKCQSLSSCKIVPKKLFSFMCLFPPLI